MDNLATLQLIRFAKEVLVEWESTTNLDSETEEVLLDVIKKNLHKSSDMVSLEACRALGQLTHLDNKEVSSAV